MGIIEAINLTSAMAAFGAAYYWWASTNVRVVAEDNGDFRITISDEKGAYDFFDTLKASTKLNWKAALSAGIAAALQGISIGWQALSPLLPLP